MTWTLKKKILIGYGIALVLMVLIVGWSLASLLRLGKASEAILTENYRSILAADNMIGAIERQDSAVLLLILRSPQEAMTQFRENEAQFLQWLGRAKDNITVEGEDKIVEGIERGYSTYLVAVSNLAIAAEADPNGTVASYRKTILPVFHQVRDACVRLRDVNQDTMFRASSRATQIAHRAVASVLIIGIGAVTLGLTFSLLLSHVLVRPLHRLADATQRLAEGDYDVRVASASSDELGRLAADFNTMAARLKAYKRLDVQQILAEKQKSEAIIRSIDDGIVVIDTDYRITGINPMAASAFATTPAEAKGRHVLEVLKNQTLFERIRGAVESGEPPAPSNDEQNVIAVQRDQTQRYYQYAVTAVRPAGESVVSIVLLLRDITRLKELDRLKSEFVMTASHELRTPLTGMEMSVELLRERAASKLDEQERQLLNAAREEILRLKSLVNDLLDISKIEAGRMEMEFERTQVGEMLEHAVTVLKNQADEKQIELSAAMPPNLPPVRADVNKITWVLTNLISNALRYTDAGGSIRLRAERVGPQVHISVADNGEGIPYEYQPRVFDKFVQVKGRKATGGSGLGLTICKEIVRAHGGTIWLDSTPGKGSTFTFTLPLVE